MSGEELQISFVRIVILSLGASNAMYYITQEWFGIVFPRWKRWWRRFWKFNGWWCEKHKIVPDCIYRAFLKISVDRTCARKSLESDLYTCIENYPQLRLSELLHWLSKYLVKIELPNTWAHPEFDSLLLKCFTIQSVEDINLQNFNSCRTSIEFTAKIGFRFVSDIFYNWLSELLQ